ncbi:hypothetical protein NQZ68_017858 [Dissostichus eleginoides]|nr:hypothetical protein NQZ68_017858 [Dissostichus eleginoides]
MEAAVLSRSRAGGLFFLFTLLGLVCITTSLMDDNELEKCKREVQELEQKLEKRKASHSGNSPSEATIAKGSMSAGLATKAQGRGHRKESIKHFEVRHQIIPFIHHRYRRSPFTHITAAMAAAVSSRSRGAAGGLSFLFTLLGLVCTAASLMDENKLKNLKEKLQEAKQDLDKLSKNIKEKLQEAKQDQDKLKAQGDTALELINGYMMDNVKLDAKMLKIKNDLRAMKISIQSLEEQHDEL